MKMKRRYYIYLGIIVVLVLSSFFWGGPRQAWNMRQVQGEIRELKETLRDDTRFTEIKFLISTANMGKNIYVDGAVADKFEIVYQVKVAENADKDIKKEQIK